MVSRGQCHQCLRAAFACANPKSARKTVKSSDPLALLGPARVKAVNKTLMKSTPEVSFAV